MEDYTPELQRLYLSFLLSDKDLFVRCNNIINSAFFDYELRESVDFIREHVDKYKDLPTLQQISAKTGTKIEEIPNITEDHKSWFVDDFEQFCRHKALEQAILASADKLEQKEYGSVERLIKEAIEVGLTKNLGTDYFADPEARIRRILEDKASVSTGWKTIDGPLYGGFDRGALNIFAGGSGSGKSIFLQNLSLNWASMGYNVIYVSLELSEELSSMRMDSMLTGFSTRDVFKKIDDVALKVAMTGKQYGRLQIVQLPNGCTINDIKSYVKEYQIQTDCMVDGICVDYLDLMMPAQHRVPPSDLYIKDKFVSEELRNLAVDGNYLFATASQLNRGSVDEVEFDHSHIAGGLSKIQTADNVIGIFTSNTLKERERVEIQFMKTRSSSGVGKKVELAMSNTSLKISDLTEEEQEEKTTSSSASKIIGDIQSRNRAQSNSPGNPTEDNVTHRSDALRGILSKIKSGDD